MRHVPLHALLKDIFATTEGKKIQRALFRAQSKVDGKDEEEGLTYIQRNGSEKWSPLKQAFIDRLGKKCWYTEVVPPGSDLEIDHYRPKRHYRWLAFDPENFRVSCAYANSPHFNEEHQCNGGKGEEFPLDCAQVRATSKAEFDKENPILLDPCEPEDCALVAFQSDGRPVIHPDFAKDPNACHRMDLSKILLNLDHPEFNKLREKLYHTIDKAVRRHDEFSPDSPSREEIEQELEMMLAPEAEFSTAARAFLRGHRDKAWVERVLEKARHSFDAMS